jgi:hypothetical protein
MRRLLIDDAPGDPSVRGASHAGGVRAQVHRPYPRCAERAPSHGGEVGSPPGKPCAGRRLADAQMRASQVGTDGKSGTLAADGVAGSSADDAQLQQIDLHWHDLRHEGACRLLADGVDIRTIQLMLGHSDIKTRQRYLNITDEELRKALTGVWERRRQLKAVGQ